MRRVIRKFCGLFYAAVAGAYRSSVVAASVCIFEPGPATQWLHPCFTSHTTRAFLSPNTSEDRSVYQKIVSGAVLF